MPGDANPTTSPSIDEQYAHREQLRQGYLDAMGIQTWYPRVQLLNAQAPRPFDWIQEDVRALKNEAATSTEPVAQHTISPSREPTPDYTPTRAADILGQFLPPAPEQPATEEKAALTNTTPEPVKSVNTVVSKFRLIVQPVTDECLVVAEMPHSGLNQFSRFHQRLLDDILRALNVTTDQAPTFREFVWPMADNRGLLSRMNQDDHSAADAVRAFLNNQYGLSRRRTILLLGQSAARFVLDPEKDFDHLRGIQQGNQPNQYFAVTYGLNELMKQSVLKREAWQDISPLLTISRT
ncbi:hypothetical protein [Endozoicomonas ascidiicola]|uniref:hypothetical protein n=1 Tax=Endozoicomonas ascidiicola TaxID=1698521 RepID=UPI00083170DF|nr:hypothetical protein [Endozoicomonas ascidiicola]